MHIPSDWLALWTRAASCHLMLRLLESACESLEKSRTLCHKPRLAALVASGGSCPWGVEPRGTESPAFWARAA